MIGNFTNELTLILPTHDEMTSIVKRDLPLVRELERMLNRLKMSGIHKLNLIQGSGDYSILKDIYITSEFKLERVDLGKSVLTLDNMDTREYLHTLPEYTGEIVIEDLMEYSKYEKRVEEFIKLSKARLITMGAMEKFHTLKRIRTNKNLTLLILENETRSFINGGPIRLDLII